jgi:hypothetical protein
MTLNDALTTALKKINFEIQTRLSYFKKKKLKEFMNDQNKVVY